MNKYISCNPETINIIKNFKILAEKMKNALLENNIAYFAILLNRHWDYQKN
jgi:galactokinase/mevalonate kinase-like predicted kinase